MPEEFWYHRPYLRQFVAGHGQLAWLPTAIIICQRRKIFIHSMEISGMKLNNGSFNHFTSKLSMQYIPIPSHNILSWKYFPLLFLRKKISFRPTKCILNLMLKNNFLSRNKNYSGWICLLCIYMSKWNHVGLCCNKSKLSRQL